MARKSQEVDLTEAVQAYLDTMQPGQTRLAGASQLDVKRVAIALGVSRTSLYKYGLDKLIKEAQQQQMAQQPEGDDGKSRALSDRLAELHQELKLAEQRNKTLLGRLNLVEANAARLGIDPEELYRPLVKPVRVVSHAGRTRSQNR